MTSPFDAGPADPRPWDLNLPFQPQDPTWSTEDVQLSGGVVVLACSIPLPGGGAHPGVMFRFAKPDGSGFYPPIMLAPDRVADLRALAGLVDQAAQHAAQVSGQ